MDRDRWNRIEEIFHTALDAPERERSEVLDRECRGDASLRVEIDELLAADRRASRFITPPAARTAGALLRSVVDARADDARSGLGPGACIGAWTIVREIGSGGMGTVYAAARQAGDFDQTVAIKVLTRGVMQRDALERFASERQTLARLNHPHICRLLDGGATDAGLPYIVMEHIDGVAVDTYANQRRASVDERIALFRDVCSAVQYAHQNLIVHRDLKPSNILVDRLGVAKLCDFGIAKVLVADAPPADVTAVGMRVMTPHYASPEQIRGDPISTASDVYSLGVVLYELLTGRSPYRFATSLPHEVERAVCERDPDPPSTAALRDDGVHTGDLERTPSAGEIAFARSTVPKKLSRRLAGDLDTIVLHALEKDPARRYASVEHLSADLDRYLNGLPILARRTTFAYRARKFVRRHRLGVAMTAAAIVVLAVSGASVMRAERVARERLSEVLRLADLTRLTDLGAQEAELWPALPERVPPMEDWLVRARDLAGHQVLHRENLAALRTRALPYDDAQRLRDRNEHPRAARLADLRVQRAGTAHRVEHGSAEAADLTRFLEAIDREIAELEALVQERRTWAFDEVEVQWQHDKLAELVQKLGAFADPDAGLIRAVERRSEFAQHVRERSVDAHALEWQHAISSIADRRHSPQYDGLTLEAEIGLVPLGPDPDSGLFEFAHLETGAIAERDADGRLTVREDTGLVFVLLPSGSFDMGARKPQDGEEHGAPNVDRLARVDELPVERVALDAFFLSKYEMTQGQWLRFTGANPSHHKPGQTHGIHVHDLRHPVEQASFDECRRVLAHLGLVLPTEAQWEYAARAGTTTPWSTGAEQFSLAGAVNLADRASERAGAPWRGAPDWPDLDDGYVVHAPVGSFRANPFGLHDVHGNVWEWCRDDFASYEIPARAGDGEREMKGTERRAGRGGSFLDAPVTARSSHRGAASPEIRDKNIGVRPARGLSRYAR